VNSAQQSLQPRYCYGRSDIWYTLALLLLLAVSLPGHAHPKTDTIMLYNGDRITGEIKSLLGGQLSLGTNAMGTILIEWQEIASVDSDYYYEVRLIDGQRLFGSVKPGALPGAVAFSDTDGERDLDWQEVVELRPVENTIIDRLDVYLSANYSFTKASGVTQTELRAEVSYEDEDALNSLTSRATVSDTDQETTTSSRASLSRKVWTDRQSLYRLVFGGYESNDELQLDYRVSLGGGLGRYFIDTNQSNLNGSFALQVLEERSNQGDRQESAEAVLSVAYSRWRFDTPKLNLLLDTSIYPSLTQGGRVRADSNARLRWELVSDLYWDLSAWGSYDSDAIETTAGEFDWGITTGLGWDF
jgi:hypothetical protein